MALPLFTHSTLIGLAEVPDFVNEIVFFAPAVYAIVYVPACNKITSPATALPTAVLKFIALVKLEPELEAFPVGVT